MSTILTEEQKKRIEANKQRALEIRAKKLENSSSSPVDKQVHNSPQFNSKPITQNISQTNSPSVTVSSQNGSQFYSRPVDNSKANYYINKFKKTSLSSATGKQEIVTGTCVLTAPDRFTVVVGYCQALISAFQSIEGRIYDAKTKNWSFPLSQYKTLLNKVSDIRDMVTLGPIPSPVLRLFNDRVSKNLAGSDLSRLTPSLLTSLYPFQKIGIQFGISKNCRCILADDMGLGKTIQALGLCDYYRDDWPLLIMCPASMRFQWDEEIRTHLPYVPESGIYVINSSKDEFLNPKVVITSYDLMSKISKQLKSIRFNIVIADESHFLKSTKANRTRVGVDLIKSARRCILLSGTPALSRPIELYSQINAIDPKFFPNMQVISIEHAMDTSDKKMKALIKKLDSEKVVGMERRGALLAYYHETGITKINAINDYITSLLEQNKKFLVFAHHQVVLDAVSKLLEDKKTFYIRIDGSVGSEERKSVVDQFQYEEKFRVAVLSITAANSGITLTAANLVVFAELFWNPGILTQAEDRAHRIGQQDSVLIQYLVAKNTADDYLWPLVMTKLDVLNRAGLSKDNFSAADTTAHNFKDPSQKSIANYFLDLDDETEVLFNSVMDDFESEIPEKKLKLST
uniref:SWI/SNF-related matrix-associated actin-dependent regulator of chromatin subfamily A-like protein 1 n=1 Tax=Cacopsylla melanoneura TaxID=428564 RepID=A0A8D8PLE3_9HEMI